MSQKLNNSFLLTNKVLKKTIIFKFSILKELMLFMFKYKKFFCIVNKNLKILNIKNLFINILKNNKQSKFYLFYLCILIVKYI